jgi:hypothetical protein
MTHTTNTIDPKESKDLDSEKDFFPMESDEIAYPDQFDESNDFIEEEEL